MNTLTQSLVALFAVASVLHAPRSQAADFELSSPTVKSGKALPELHVLNGFGCSGGNRSPAVHWRGAPPGTQSFALTVFDPDAPTGSGWWHWVVYDIPATADALPAGAGSPDGGALPAGARQGRTDFGTQGFGGACPPAGDKPHRYRFTLYALKAASLQLPADPSPAMVGFMIHSQTLESVTLEAVYGR